jgi:hypothetical protein
MRRLEQRDDTTVQCDGTGVEYWALGALEPEEASISVILINVFRQLIVAWHPRCGTRLTVFSANMSSRPSFVLLAQLPPLSPRVCIEAVALYRVDCKVKGRLAVSKKVLKMA